MKNLLISVFVAFLFFGCGDSSTTDPGVSITAPVRIEIGGDTTTIEPIIPQQSATEDQSDAIWDLWYIVMDRIDDLEVMNISDSEATNITIALENNYESAVEAVYSADNPTDVVTSFETASSEIIQPSPEV